jgi:hypothetical protein
MLAPRIFLEIQRIVFKHSKSIPLPWLSYLIAFPLSHLCRNFVLEGHTNACHYTGTEMGGGSRREGADEDDGPLAGRALTCPEDVNLKVRKCHQHLRIRFILLVEKMARGKHWGISMCESPYFVYFESPAFLSPRKSRLEIGRSTMQIAVQ